MKNGKESGVTPLWMKAVAVYWTAVVVVLSSLAFAPAIARAAALDEGKGLSYVCFRIGGGTKTCEGGDRIVLGIPVLGDFDWDFWEVERSAVVNVEVFDQFGHRTYIGRPNVVALRNGTARARIVLPSSVTWAAVPGVVAYYQVWVYVTGQKFDTSDSQEFWITVNVPMQPSEPPMPTPPMPPLPVPCPDCKG